MAGPTTEILNEDLKDLRREVHERYDSLTRDFQALRVDFADLRGQLNVTLRIMSWAGTLFVTTVLTTGSASLWWASSLNRKVDQMELRIDERFRAAETRSDDRFRAIDERFKATDARLVRIESAINRLIEQGRSIQPAPKPEDVLKK